MTNDLRERVARAIYECDPMLRRSPGGGLEKVPWDELSQWDQSVAFATADAAIDAMGLPTREQVEAALDDFNEAIIMEERGFCSEKAILAERQRLLAMIPMTEATDDR